MNHIVVSTKERLKSRITDVFFNHLFHCFDQSFIYFDDNIILALMSLNEMQRMLVDHFLFILFVHLHLLSSFLIFCIAQGLGQGSVLFK